MRISYCSSVVYSYDLLFIAVIFIVSGINKLIHVNDTNSMISAVGLPGGLAIPTGLFELIAGVCLALGVATRLWSILLAAFVLLTILFFHREFTDPMQAMAAMKNLAIAGGLLCLFGYGNTRWSYDARSEERRVGNECVSTCRSRRSPSH